MVIRRDIIRARARDLEVSVPYFSGFMVIRQGVRVYYEPYR